MDTTSQALAGLSTLPAAKSGPVPAAPRDCSPGPDAAGFCPIHEGLRLLQGAWTPEVLWQLRQGSKRFGELRRALGRISAKVLTTRLRELEQRGLLERHVLASSPPSVEYRLTDLAHEIQPVLCSIAELGTKLHARQVARTPGDAPA
ncbi:MAG: helix-turn-helix domain-containing protein [Planctomycetota bacterium]|nr:helix-turn-helix domain-containing protein [Planctomycetota bacterium]